MPGHRLPNRFSGHKKCPHPTVLGRYDHFFTIIEDNQAFGIDHFLPILIKMPFPLYDIRKGLVPSLDRVLEPGFCGNANIQVLRIYDNILYRAFRPLNFPTDYLYFHAPIEDYFRDLLAFYIPIARIHHFV